MQRIFYILFLCFVAGSTAAQDSTSVKKEGVVAGVRKSLKDLQSPGIHKLSTDTITTLPFDSLKAKQKLDSLKGLADTKKQKLNSVTDSVNRIISLPSQKIHQLTSAVNTHADSLVKTINKPVDALNKKVAEAQKSAQTKSAGFEERATGEVIRIQNGAQQNANQTIPDQLNLPGVDPQLQNLNLNLPTDDLKIRPLSSDDAKLSIANQDIPRLEIPPVTDAFKLPNTQLNTDGIQEKTKLKIPEMEKAKNISGELGNIDGKLAEVQKYEEEVKNIRENGLGDAKKLPEEIEKRVGGIDEIKSLNEQAEKFSEQRTEYQAMLEKYRDKKLVQEEILRKAKNIANDKFSKYSPHLKNAQEQIAKAKKINPVVQSFKEMAKKRPNEMKGKSFRQRFIPGITLQIYNQDNFIIDWAAQAGYKVSGRFTAGIGYCYRISFSKSHTNWVRSEGLSGYRVYSEFALLKGLFAHGELEALTADITKQPKLSENPQLLGSYFGLGKRYNISRKVRGSAMALYKVDYKGEVPGLSKINLRMGFDLSLKQKRKSQLLK